MSINIRNAGLACGIYPAGPGNSITDIPGTSIGHYTLSSGEIQTGVTAVIPCSGNIYTSKLPAACHVVNGYGKTAGLLQISELGNIETPIVLTNTLSVGTAFQALAQYMLERNPDIGICGSSVNPVVCECNDGYLNDIRGMHITPEMVRCALDSASGSFAEGAVGAGRGMSCHGLKGGIGSSSRIVNVDGESFTLGCLVLTNHAKLEELLIGGRPVGKTLAAYAGEENPFKGSVIIIIATDAPFSSRQLGRLCRRSAAGLARSGSVVASGSGEIALAYSTAASIPHDRTSARIRAEFLHEDLLDPFFSAEAEMIEEAVLSSLWEAETLKGRAGHVRYGLREALDKTGGLPC